VTERQPNATGASSVRRTVTLIPIRLPGQLEAIKDALAKAETEAAEEAKKTATPADQEAFLKEQAAFVSHAVHELRTPMTSIRGYSDMMRSMGALNDMQKMAVETIRNNSRRMESLLTDVSDTSKLKAGTLRTNVKMDMFKNIAMMVEKLAQPATEELGRKLTTDIPQGLPILNVDGELLAKALYKLVENGLRYTDKDAETALVTLRAAADGSKLVITVQDNGIGMTPEELNQLGTIYYRADNELVRGYKGSGLGVPVAYGIIRMLGGTTEVTSEPSKGTTFTITLTGMS
jgi:signal transduction histidine kinase